MNPSSNQSPEMQLPPPILEEAMAGTQVAEAALVTPETPAAKQEMSPAVGQFVPLSQSPNSLAQSPPLQQQLQNAVTKTTKGVVPDAADDGDLIEKEWVNKAKEIVRQTQDDPYKESKELTVFKADYMQKRYGKTIKLGE